METLNDVLVELQELQIPKALYFTKVCFARLPSILRFDPRVKLTNAQITSITKAVQDRIFRKGWNANDEQTLPALSYQSPRGLYRYLTGTLYNSIRIELAGDGALSMYFAYEDVILAVLEDRYGFTFQWSPSDTEYVMRIVEDQAIAQGLTPLSELTPADVVRITNPDERKNMQDLLNIAINIGRDNEAQREQERGVLTKDKEDYEKRKGDRAKADTNIPTRDGEYVPKEGTVRKSLKIEYDPRAILTPEVYAQVEQNIKNRIRQEGRNALGEIIPADIRDIVIDYRTINALSVTKSKNGTLSLNVTYYDLNIPEIEKRRGAVYAWSQDEIDYIDQWVQMYLQRKNLTPNIATQALQ